MKPTGFYSILFLCLLGSYGAQAQGNTQLRSKTSGATRKTGAPVASSGVRRGVATGGNASPGNSAESITGIWRGYFITESGDQYKLEFQVAAKPGSAKGVSYSYLDTRFYGKATMTGAYSISNKVLNIQELRTVEVRNLAGNSTCLMNYKLEFSESGKELFLEGSYLGKREDRQNPKNNGSWGDCGGGRVYLRRVETSDFYEEPFLRNRDVAKNKDSAGRKRISPPVVHNTAKPPVTKAPAKNATASKPAISKPGTAPRATNSSRNTDDVARNNRVSQPVGTVQAVETPKKPEIKPIPVPVQTRNRENATTKVLTVTHDEITVKLYDNGEIDGDTISVYLDNKLVLSNKGLSASPLELKVKLDENSPEHTLVMVAENLGRIPPNTSLMIVWDGDKRYEVQITSTEQKNAMVRFRYQKPASEGSAP